MAEETTCYQVCQWFGLSFGHVIYNDKYLNVTTKMSSDVFEKFKICQISNENSEIGPQKYYL